MILSDKDNLYMKHGTVEKLTEKLGLLNSGMYLTFKAFEYDHPGGVEEVKLFNCSSDGTKRNKEVLEDLISKGYLKRNNKGLIISTNKEL